MKHLHALICLSLLIPSLASSSQPSVRFSEWEITHPNPSGAWFYAAAWGDLGCVAVGMNAEIAFSGDGSSWKNILSPFHQSEETKNVTLFDVCYGNGTYVAVGGLYNRGYTARSTDGVNWQIAETSSPAYLRGVCYGDGKFVAVVDTTVLTSQDGLSWQALSESPGMRKVTYGEGRWVGISGDGKYHYSDDLVSWTTVWGDFLGFIQENICYGAGRFLSVGGWGYDGRASVIQWSGDGTSWNFATSDDGESIWGVQKGCAYANGTFVIAGANRQSGYNSRSTYTSDNASSWSREQSVSPANVHAPNGYLTDVAGYDGKPFIAVSSIGEVWRGSDGIDWTVIDSKPREYLKSLAYADGHYVAVGGRTDYIGGPLGAAAIFSSVDGVDWQAFIPDRIDTLSDITYGEGIWVATGDDGGIFTSEDVINWTDRSWPDTFNDLDIVVYGAGRFIAFSKNRDRIYHSEDSIVWQVTDGPPVADVNFAMFIKGEFVACGDNGLFLTSANGFDWIDLSIETNEDLYALSYGKGNYVLSGYEHVYSSANKIDWRSSEIQSPPRQIIYSRGWFVGNDLRASRDGLYWHAPPENFFPDYSRFESIEIVGKQFVGIDGLELWRASIDLEELNGLTLIEHSGLELPTQSNKSYRLLQSDNLKNWVPNGSWIDGSGDYFLWNVDYTGSRRFWKVEIIDQSE
jgi:hypothetical protein